MSVGHTPQAYKLYIVQLTNKQGMRRGHAMLMYSDSKRKSAGRSRNSHSINARQSVGNSGSFLLFCSLFSSFDA